jgi:acetyl-CoA carboxylase alpha subunit
MNYLDFEKPLAEIEGKAEELRALARANEEMDVEEEAAALDKKADDLLAISTNPDAMAEMPGRAPSRPPALQGLHRGALHRFHAAGGGPELRRRPRGHGRACAVRRYAGGGDRP